MYFMEKTKTYCFRIARNIIVSGLYTDVLLTNHHTTEIISTDPFLLLSNCLQIHTDSHPGMIVLGVTPGYALKLKHRISNKGTFINPGSAGEFVHLLVFGQSLDMSKCKLNKNLLGPYKINL